MPKNPLAMALAKVIIAAAWADGHLASDEVNSLKNILAELGQTGGSGEMALTANEWGELEIYLHSPVDAAERARLVDGLAAALRGPGDRALALAALDQMLRADRVITGEERAVADQIRAALERVDLGLIAQIGRLLRGANPAGGPNREQYLEEFLNNRIYYAVRQRLGVAPEDDLGIPADEAHTLALAGGLLARVARVDNVVTEAEFVRIAEALESGWGISRERAALVAEVALAESTADLDYFRLTKEFADGASVEDRVRFLDALFAVSAADGEISSDESAEISRITASINLTHSHFVAAKRRARGDMS
ncbi:TerB family tellurite resistance protein [Oscillochloris sp. ZM17-4]|uniref:tellurite resistance TerB family protein n=1 Tax=Oscillochloris sp. ZM17-4 TaxID=2866714 RepID=UPI001C732C4A|nr:TerB family tellurite resistance protein [Oscillochloris sp. ZM17-4]MBX0326297.1 TerB family tellurite resistance protein [Oscillochloris sp. ZM17-4]